MLLLHDACVAGANIRISRLRLLVRCLYPRPRAEARAHIVRAKEKLICGVLIAIL
jgi:hypothetical protein